MKKYFKIVTVAFIFSVFATGCGDSGVTVSDAWVREVPPGIETTALYMKISNNSSENEKLLSIESELADNAEIHETSVNKDGISRMRQIQTVEIPASGSVSMKPGGIHVMLIGLKDRIENGQDIKVVLKFQNTGTREITAKVKGFDDK